MECADILIDWDNEKELLQLLNERIYKITEDPCVSPYQCLLILGYVEDLALKKAYQSAIKSVADKNIDAKADIGRCETYRLLYNLYSDCIINQSSPEMDPRDYYSFGRIDITIQIGEESITINSIEDLIAYMMETDNWFKPDKFLITWNEHRVKEPFVFDSSNTENWDII